MGQTCSYFSPCYSVGVEGYQIQAQIEMVLLEPLDIYVRFTIVPGISDDILTWPLKLFIRVSFVDRKLTTLCEKTATEVFEKPGKGIINLSSQLWITQRDVIALLSDRLDCVEIRVTKLSID